jgi:hypothetical protein
VKSLHLVDEHMKQGFSFALGLIVMVLAMIILVQHRKLSRVRTDNATLRGDARAITTTRVEDAAAAGDLQREVRQLRSENEQLRRELQQFRRTSNVANP